MTVQHDPFFNRAPRIVIWEMTRACALACAHCRASAIPRRDPHELSTREAFELVDQIVACDHPLFVLTGGDPLMRDDIYKIVEHATSQGLTTAVTPSATGRLTADAIRHLSMAGAHRLALSLDAPEAEAHDAFRGVRGSYDRTLAAIEYAHESGLQVQINTTLSRNNIDSLEAFAPLLEQLDIALWSIFFLVPTGRASIDAMLDAGQTEDAFARIYELSRQVPFPVKTTEAPHYRRFVLQKTGVNPPTAGIGDGRGFVFVSHIGEVYPSGFLPVAVGNVRTAPLLDIYRNTPLMQRLRQPQTFDGKCGVCEFQNLCGGSRARAYAVSGKPYGSDPTCVHVPAALREAQPVDV